MTLYKLVQQWLRESKFEYIARSRNGYQVIIVTNPDNPIKVLLLIVYDDSVGTSKGTLYASNPKFFGLLRKRILQGLRD